MDNSGFYIDLGFFLCWLSDGFGLLMLYRYSRKCKYDCANCRAWHCQGMACYYKRRRINDGT